MRDVEFIIIDGSSTDLTNNYVQSLSLPTLTYICENDQGIYDAMNKGMLRATGMYVLFMNSGDRFHDPYLFKEVVDILRNDTPDIVYSDTMMVDKYYQPLGLRSKITTRKIPAELTWKSMWYGMLICHQSFIAKKKICEPYILGNLSADIDWQIKCLKLSNKIVRYNGLIADYLEGGTSKQRHWESLRDRFVVMRSHYGLIQALVAHIWFVIRKLIFYIR